MAQHCRKKVNAQHQQQQQEQHVTILCCCFLEQVKPELKPAAFQLQPAINVLTTQATII